MRDRYRRDFRNVRLILQAVDRFSRCRVAPFLQADFSRVSPRVAREICDVAGVAPTARVKSLEHKAAEALHKAISKVKIMNPPTDCLSPIGEDLTQRFFLSCSEPARTKP